MTGIRKARGFTYLRFRKSFAYYYPDSNPTILYNFKGEPRLWEQMQSYGPIGQVL